MKFERKQDTFRRPLMAALQHYEVLVEQSVVFTDQQIEKHAALEMLQPNQTSDSVWSLSNEIFNHSNIHAGIIPGDSLPEGDMPSKELNGICPCCFPRIPGFLPPGCVWW